MPRAAAIASRLALAILLAAAFLRALVVLDPFPYWSGDPTLINTPTTTVGPAGSILLDAISLLAAAIILAAEPVLGRRIHWLPLVLLGMGAVGIVAHGWSPRMDLDNIRIGATWAAALFGALACAHAARDIHAARLIAGAATGLVAMLAAKGMVQVFIEHPMTVEEYQRSRAAFLAAQGWAPGSAAALNFERRLTQPEATAWFGLANIVASFGAATLATLLGWAILAWRETRSREETLPSGWSGLLTIGALASLATLLMSGAKGGFAAGALGIGLLIAATLRPATLRPATARGATARPALRRAVRTLPPILPHALIAAALATLLLRGVLGERLGELSLLFRWFYIETAARIFAAHPLLGVGPADFQNAYQLLKPAISPEEVTSPHSILFDFASTLGLFGIALGAVFLHWASRAGSVLLGEPSSPPHQPIVSPPPSRPDLWFILFVAAVPTLLSAWIEAPLATPDSTIMRLLALGAWAGIALAALALMRLGTPWRVPFAAGAIVLAVHGQIEVTPVWPGSASLFFLMLGSAGALPLATHERPSRWMSMAALAPLLLAALIALTALPAAARWQRALHRAADRFSVYAEFRSRLETLEQSPRPLSGDSLERLSADLTTWLGPDAPREPDPRRALPRLFERLAASALPHIEDAALSQFPDHLPTRLAASRLSMQSAQAADTGSVPDAERWADRAERHALAATESSPGSAAAWGWLGTLRAARATLDDDPVHLSGAITAWQEAAAKDPHGLSMPLRLMRAYDKAGRPEQARQWAVRALAMNANLRLDPLKQLKPADLAEAQRLAGR